MKGSLVIVGFFVLGILAGLSGIVPEKLVEGDLTFYALCAPALLRGDRGRKRQEYCLQIQVP